MRAGMAVSTATTTTVPTTMATSHGVGGTAVLPPCFAAS